MTLEAMLSSKPVLTCTDSGGPLEFVRDGENGWIVPPEPAALAQRIDWIAGHERQAEEIGRGGQADAAGASHRLASGGGDADALRHQRRGRGPEDQDHEPGRNNKEYERSRSWRRVRCRLSLAGQRT
ncbi:glycosyltransferase [Cupriavidus basilensis]